VHRAENRQAMNIKTLFRTSLFVPLFMCCLWSEACSSVDVDNRHLSNTTLMRAERVNHLRLLFAQQTQDSTKLQTPPSFKLKSPYMAVFYSVIPGTVLHGAGHVYAGKIGTGIACSGPNWLVWSLCLRELSQDLERRSLVTEERPQVSSVWSCFSARGFTI
jgi:hypothetical protein